MIPAWDRGCCYPSALLSTCSCCVCLLAFPSPGGNAPNPSSVAPPRCFFPLSCSSFITLSLCPWATGEFPAVPEQTHPFSTDPCPDELLRFQAGSCVAAGARSKARREQRHHWAEHPELRFALVAFLLRLIAGPLPAPTLQERYLVPARPPEEQQAALWLLQHLLVPAGEAQGHLVTIQVTGTCET